MQTFIEAQYYTKNTETSIFLTKQPLLTGLGSIHEPESSHTQTLQLQITVDKCRKLGFSESPHFLSSHSAIFKQN